MIKSITIINASGDALELELMRPEKSGFIVKSVDGLGPTSATINMTDVATINGSLYNSSRLGRRDIVMTLAFYEGMINGRYMTIEDIRHESYKYMPPQENVQIIIETSKRILKTNGFVQANDPDIFSQNEGCSVTINCEDALLYAEHDQQTLFSTIEPAFEFPFPNESLTEPSLEMGKLIHKQDVNIYYDGDYDIGMIMTIHAVGNVNSIKIVNEKTNESMRIDNEKLKQLTTSGIQDGDTIIIDTRDRYQRITLLREGIEINILNCLDRGTDWIALRRGDNHISYHTEDGDTNADDYNNTAKYLQFTITNKIAYLGV